MLSANHRRLWNIAAAVLLAKAAETWIQNLWISQRNPLLFDDAHMFARYARNVRAGFGISWNPDGVHTYGQTAPLWGGLVVLFSHLPIGTWKMLTLGSWLWSIAAVIALAWAVAANAQSALMSSTWRVLPLVVLPLTDTLIFFGNQATGMETMLATFLAAMFVGLTLLYRRGAASPVLVALVGFLLFLTRPESAIAVLLFPPLVATLLPGPILRRRGVLTILGIFLAAVLVELLVCKAYFHTALPLSFYMKSKHGYEGYHEVWHPELLMLAFLAGCQLYLAVLILLGRRRDWKLIACCVTPALAVFAYLGTVTQIMGFNARYYTPYFPFFIVPALLVLDRWLASDEPSSEERWPGKTLLVRSCSVALMMICFLGLSSESVQAGIRRLERRSHFEYEPAHLVIQAASPLPEMPWGATMADITDQLVAPLPAGTTVAATEVGYLGSRSPQINIIDLAGLNDTDIALHGFDVAALLQRRPDIIWMPNTSYTFQRGEMFADPEFPAQYDVYAGAANYGIALRKDSPVRSQIDRQMQIYWSAVYPGYSMSDYLVRSASWSGRKFKVTGD
jgi:hypothetical protein